MPAGEKTVHAQLVRVAKKTVCRDHHEVLCSLLTYTVMLPYELTAFPMRKSYRHSSSRLPLLLASLLATLPVQAVEPRDAGPSRVVVFEGESRWNRVLVVDEGRLRYLRFHDVDGDDQSEIVRDDPAAVPMEYIRFAAVALAVPEQLRRALVVGLGAGAFPMLLRRVRPQASIEVVELDPLVHQVATRYFGFKEDSHLRVRIGDGALAFRDGRRWDLIFLDAYGAASIPEPLATAAFFGEVSHALAAGGVVVANIANPDSAAEKATISRFAAAFAACALVHTPESDNVIVLGAGKLPADLTPALRQTDRKGWLPFALAPMAARFRNCER
jgi:spermidine synthase